MENEIVQLILLRQQDVIVVFQAEAGAEAPGCRADLEIVVTDGGGGPAPRLRGVSAGQRHAEGFLRMGREGRGEQPQHCGNPWERRATCWSDVIANQFLLTTSQRLKLLDEAGK